MLDDQEGQALRVQRRMWRSMASTMTGLTPEVGSSSRTRRGRPISTAPNSSSLRWPKDSVAGAALGQAHDAELVEDLARALLVGRT